MLIHQRHFPYVVCLSCCRATLIRNTKKAAHTCAQLLQRERMRSRTQASGITPSINQQLTNICSVNTVMFASGVGGENVPAMPSLAFAGSVSA